MKKNLEKSSSEKRTMRSSEESGKQTSEMLGRQFKPRGRGQSFLGGWGQPISPCANKAASVQTRAGVLDRNSNTGLLRSGRSLVQRPRRDVVLSCATSFPVGNRQLIQAAELLFKPHPPPGSSPHPPSPAWDPPPPWKTPPKIGPF